MTPRIKQNSKVPSENPSQTAQKSRMLIMDDDAVFCENLKTHLLNSFPTAEIETGSEQKSQLGYDVYFVNNCSNGNEADENLIKQMKSQTPDAFVVCFSSTLTPAELTSLVNKGCNLVYKKEHVKNPRGAGNMINSIVACRRIPLN